MTDLLRTCWAALGGDPGAPEGLEVRRRDTWLGGPLDVDGLAVGATGAALHQNIGAAESFAVTTRLHDQSSVHPDLLRQIGVGVTSQNDVDTAHGCREFLVSLVAEMTEENDDVGLLFGAQFGHQLARRLDGVS